VSFDAIGALSDVSDGDGNDLLHPRRNRAVRKNCLAEGLEGGLLIWRQIAPLPRDFHGGVRIHRVTHGISP
jgi:hypothetical protein